MVEPRRDIFTKYSTVEEPHIPYLLAGDTLRAKNSMSFREFIAVVKFLWENLHPEIAIHPTQGPQFAQYPVITYSVELRRSHPAEPKTRFREEVIDEEGNIYNIYARRFQNLIAFSVHTRTDPALAEAIIEEFEIFMDNYIGTFKENGASEIVFSRRMSDREENRTSEDISIRTAVWLVTLERVSFRQQAKIEKITASVSTFIDFQRVPSFEVTADQVGTDELTLLHGNVLIAVGDEIILRAIDNSFFTFPSGILHAYTFVVYEVGLFTGSTPSQITIKITEESGGAVSFLSAGKGWWMHSTTGDVTVSLPDILAVGATPSS